MIFFYLAYFFSLFFSLFKLCISTFDSWKLFVFVFGIWKCTYFDLHEYEGLKDKLLSLLLCWTAKKKSYKKIIILWIKVKRKQIYIGKKWSKKTGSSTQLFVANLFVVYWNLLAIKLSLRVSVLSPLNLFGSPIIF